jgi:TPR repeat protein
MLATVAAVIVWQLLPSPDPDGSLAGSPLAGRDDADPVAAAPARVHYDVEGIEGIVDIDPALTDDTPGASRQTAVPLAELGRAARAGDTGSMTSLALLLRTGSDAAADPHEAIEWLERAATAGDADAMATLAAEYETGAWLPADPRKARALREAAARAGSQLARWELEL